MTGSSITAVLVHDAFAENASWSAVITRLGDDGVRAVAAANPLRGVAVDAAAVAARARAVDGPVVLVGHGYGGTVMTAAAAHVSCVEALVYVAALAPGPGETVLAFTGDITDDVFAAVPDGTGGVELTVRPDRFHDRVCADLGAATAALLAVTQRGVAERALREPFPDDRPAWRTVPSWFVSGGADRSIPPAVHAFLAERARARGVTVVAGASHAVPMSEPDVVTRTVLAAIAG